ncbi:MAG: zinc ribbon domain-containing protein [Thermoleophilia bacterium]|nr:zinc ribbon domain-containing protein [Thermoleophilia bacterium]
MSPKRTGYDQGGVTGDYPQSYCVKCGSPLNAEQAFCAACGTSRDQARSLASRSAQGIVAQAAGLAGAGFALPWHTLAGAGRPDIGALLSAAALPGAQQAIRASLKRPGLALAATTVLDVAVAVITGGTSALYKALPRLVLGGATSVLSLVTGAKGGGIRKATGIVGGVTALAQLGFVAYTLISGAGDVSAWVLVPQVVAMVSSFVMAVKTTFVALRGPR